GYEQIHEDALVVVKVDAVGEFRVLFDPRSRAAPEGLVLGAEGLPRTRSVGEVVHGGSRLRIDGAQAVVQHHSLVIVEVAGIAGPGIELAGQLQRSEER